jgi:nucleoside-diphosphate-sugar epimerase
MTTIMITGARGFLGKALGQKARQEGCSVVALDAEDGDIANKDLFSRYEHDGIEHVFHLAARTYVPDSWDNPYEFYMTNVMGTGNVLEFCKRKKLSLTYVSAYLYGQPDTLPISEDHPLRPNNPYAQSKHLAEQLCQFYAKHHQTRTTIIRPFNIFGAGQNGKFLIPHIIRQALHGQDIQVKDLLPRRDYVYIDDVVDALMRTVQPAWEFSIFNIGAGHSLSVREIIDIIQDILGTSKQIVTDRSVRQNELPDVVADISKASRLLHWQPRHDFREAMEEVLRTEKERQSS